MRTICLNQGSFELPESVATIGVFDGVHAGHQLLIGMVKDEAHRTGLSSMVITFDRHPRQLFDPTFRPQVLTTLEEKQAIVESLGIDVFVVLPFTKEFAELTAHVFMQKVLHQQLNVKTLITGYDNRFGRNRSEGFEDYVRYGKEMGMKVLRGKAAMIADRNITISSSVIRQLLSEEGKVEQMPRYLTRNYQLSGEVTPGEHIGRQLGFPTANLEPLCAEKLLPASGAYAVWATLMDGQRRAAMMNIGTRPTFKGKQQTLEVNILDYEANLYGQIITISFVARLREERKFDSPEALVNQLKKDQEQVKKILI
ncbi:riboflavin kinase / FMN adenylyltransferase [Xylanibacter ruminicola]|jgi:riboflavin kinase/FMN adenylyltransferase|uniref:Riboflavin biosynthesis protein n=1 Tax=Xylanibacter ruminicola TaxID=839 RepID=A0A1H5TCL2_XYLRU|nr:MULTISPECIES: bifunctional riboflavin kinase/FAD synthetase [Prevotellaceae]MCR5469475.1 bifunctional riboflavin kinase/FAD synthetase [Prevotella sp.]SEF59831.1 riboflavin kinase / FMN adenylyltransferase [Xylanibacter ruminicola]SEV99160.1 riboflavin kinase / FMN adenylyltransferase [Prevotella sp. khp7]